MRITLRTVGTSLLVLTLLAACGTKDKKPAPDNVIVQLKWVHQAQFVGFYVAQEQGFYADENIAITLVEGGPNISIIDQVSTGQANFGVDAPEYILAARSQGKTVVAIAVIYRNNPMAFVTLANSGIVRPSDFLGHTAGVGGADGELQLVAMMKKLNLDMTQVEILPYTRDYTAFYNGEIDIMQAYSTSGLIRMRRDGYAVNLIWPSNYGVHLYADTLLTTDQLISENPDLVERFLRATLNGWREAVENPDVAVQDTLKYVPDPDVDLQTAMMEASIPLVHTGEDQIGWMKSDVWSGMYQMLLDQDLLDRPFDVSTVYTMRFLDNIYGKTP